MSYRILFALLLALPVFANRKHMDDPRVPEALHLAVKASRFGCTDKTTSKYSREAFQILHKNFPNSEWIKKTPYYY